MRIDWRRKFSDAELDFIKRRKKMPRRELHAEFIQTFGRKDISVLSIKWICQSNGWRTGRTGHFEKGSKPKSPFKKGGRPMHPFPKTWPIGSEYVDRCGYVRLYVAPRKFVVKHRILWERANGPIPVGYRLKCKGDRSNCDPSNWEAIPNGMIRRLCQRNYDAAPAELKPTIMAVAKLEDFIRRKSGEEKVVQSKPKRTLSSKRSAQG